MPEKTEGQDDRVSFLNLFLDIHMADPKLDTSYMVELAMQISIERTLEWAKAKVAMLSESAMWEDKEVLEILTGIRGISGRKTFELDIPDVGKATVDYSFLYGFITVTPGNGDASLFVSYQGAEISSVWIPQKDDSDFDRAKITPKVILRALLNS